MFMVFWHILRQRMEEDFILLCVTKIYCVEGKAKALKKQECKNYSFFIGKTVVSPVQWTVVHQRPFLF